MSEDKTFRVDKFLWCVRAYKTRSQATEACNSGKIIVNDTTSKPSRKININDIITYRNIAITKTIKVIDIPRSRIGAKLVSEYIEDLTPKEEYEKYAIYVQQQKEMHYRGTIGRPTKKDRRDLEKFKDKF